MPANGKTKGKFELLALAPVNYSLTDGTSIPPPPDSPTDENSRPAARSDDTEHTSSTTNHRPAALNADAQAALEGRGRSSVYNMPMSPASSRRPSSIRKFLSRKSLHVNYTNGADQNGSSEDLPGRPESRNSLAPSQSLSKKKSGSWFKRLSSVNRTATVYENEPEPKEPPKGPPPPKLPELNQLRAKISDGDEGSLGGEGLFKNIR